MPSNQLEDARATAQHLPENTLQATLRCPLCSATAPVRGLIYRTLGTGERRDLAFICPTCGLYTTFDLQHLKIDQLARIHGSHWAATLREPEQSAPVVETPVQAARRTANIVTTFTACAVMWLLLTGSFATVDVLWGLIVCTGVTMLTYRFTAFGAPRWMQRPGGWLALVGLMAEFIRQLVVQNVTLSWRVFSPRMPIKPGIVAVPYKIHGDVPLTILTSLMTLTPDTVVVDIDQQKKIMYIHWIDVQNTDPEQMYQMLVADLEKRVVEWLKDN